MQAGKVKVDILQCKRGVLIGHATVGDSDFASGLASGGSSAGFDGLDNFGTSNDLVEKV